MEQQPLYIAFGHHQVRVCVDTPEPLVKIEQWFDAMLEPDPSCVVRQLLVTRQGNEYALHAKDEVLEVRGNLKEILQAVKYEVVMGLIQARPDLLWLHAGAVADGTGALILPAAGGSGKSTLVTQLCRRGWRYLSDDVVPLDLTTGKVLPFPQTPRVRENVGQELPAERLAELDKFDFALLPEMVCLSLMPIKALVFPSYRFGASTYLSPCSAGTTALELLRNCVNFHDHKQVAVGKVCELVRELPAFQLSFSEGEGAAEAIATYSLR